MGNVEPLVLQKNADVLHRPLPYTVARVAEHGGPAASSLGPGARAEP